MYVAPLKSTGKVRSASEMGSTEQCTSVSSRSRTRDTSGDAVLLEGRQIRGLRGATSSYGGSSFINRYGLNSSYSYSSSSSAAAAVDAGAGAGAGAGAALDLPAAALAPAADGVPTMGADPDPELAPDPDPDPPAAVSSGDLDPDPRPSFMRLLDAAPEPEPEPEPDPAVALLVEPLTAASARPAGERPVGAGARAGADGALPPAPAAADRDPAAEARLPRDPPTGSPSSSVAIEHGNKDYTQKGGSDGDSGTGATRVGCQTHLQGEPKCENRSTYSVTKAKKADPACRHLCDVKLI